MQLIDPKAHWEPTKAIKASIYYCTKLESRTGKVYAWPMNIIPKENMPIDVMKPYGWQLEIMNIIEQKTDPRTVYWFWEPNGNVGKSQLCKYLVVKHNALMLTGKANDMYHMISKYPEKRELMIFDIPRSAKDYVSWGAIEQCKNGLVFSGKYDSCQVVFNVPHIICFANQLPDTRQLSADRWKIIDIRTLIGTSPASDRPL